MLRSEQEKMGSNLNSVSQAFLCAVAIFNVPQFMALIEGQAVWQDTCGSGSTVPAAALVLVA